MKIKLVNKTTKTEDYVLATGATNIIDITNEITNFIGEVGLEKIKEKYIFQLEF